MTTDCPNPNNMSIRRMMHLPSIVHVYALLHHPKHPTPRTVKRIWIAFERMQKRPLEVAKMKAFTSIADRNWLGMGFVVSPELAAAARHKMPN